MEARAKAFGHPIHQMLVVFPLGLFSTAVIFDVIHLIRGGPMWSIAGSTGIRCGRMIRPRRRGLPCSGQSCAGEEPNRCAPTQTRPCAGSRRGAS